MTNEKKSAVGFQDNFMSPLDFLMGSNKKKPTETKKWSNTSGIDIITRVTKNAVDVCSRKHVILLDIGSAEGKQEYERIHNDGNCKIINKEGKYTTYEHREGKDSHEKDESYKFMIEYVEVDNKEIIAYFDNVIASGLLAENAVLGIISSMFSTVKDTDPDWIEKIEKDMERKELEALNRGKQDGKDNKKGDLIDRVKKQEPDEEAIDGNNPPDMPIIYQK